MANELTVQDISNMSVAFAKSGFFGYKSAAEAFSLMCIAQANGLHPAKAAERYHIIQGRPAMKADAMLSSFQEAGGKVKWIKRTDTECKLWLSHPQGGELEVTWTIERAKKAGITGKQTWQQYPTQMLAARCVSEGVRALFPACLSGMYTPEEVGDFATVAPTYPPEETEAEVFDEAPIEKPKKETTKEKPKQATGEKQKKENFVLAMNKLHEANAKVYEDAMKIYAYDKPEDVPADKRRDVFGAINDAINAAAQQNS